MTTPNPSKLQRLLVKAESSWAESATDMSSAVALPVLGGVDVQINQPMVETGRTVQYRNQGTSGAPGVFDCTLSYDLFLGGHGSTMVGSPSLTDLENHLALILGGNSAAPTLSSAASTTDNGGGASTVTSITTAAANGFVAGGLFRVGAKGDSGGDGQTGVVSAHAANTLTTRVALPAAPAQGAVIYPMAMVYTVEDGTSGSITGQRFLWMTANTQWLVHGCYPTGFSLSGLNGGEMPKVKCSWKGSWAEPRAATFPDTTSMATNTPPPIAAGSLFVQAFGTTTRNLLSYRDLKIDFTLGTIPLMGGDGVSPYQNIVGAVRTIDSITVSITVDAGAASTSPTYWSAWLTNSWHHIDWTGATADGQALAIYLARCKYMGARPTQGTSGDLNAVTLTFQAHTNDQVTTSALTLSAMRIGLG